MIQTNNTYLGNAINDLNESRNRFRDTFEQAAVGIAHHTKARNWIRINQRTCDLLGYYSCQRFDDVKATRNLVLLIEYYSS